MNQNDLEDRMTAGALKSREEAATKQEKYKTKEKEEGKRSRMFAVGRR